MPEVTGRLKLPSGLVSTYGVSHGSSTHSAQYTSFGTPSGAVLLA
jgi:hypothetical protein